MPKAGDGPMTGLLTVDTELVKMDVNKVWTARGVKVPIVLGKCLLDTHSFIKY